MVKRRKMRQCPTKNRLNTVTFHELLALFVVDLIIVSLLFSS